jgi:excisionase family DNA binding protein
MTDAARAWTVTELARAIHASPSSVRRACQNGRIPAETSVGGHWRISAAYVAQRFPNARRAANDNAAPAATPRDPDEYD